MNVETTMATVTTSAPTDMDLMSANVTEGMPYKKMPSLAQVIQVHCIFLTCPNICFRIIYVNYIFMFQLLFVFIFIL